MELTEQGKVFQEYTSLALANYDKGISIAHELAGEANGRLKLGTIYAMQGHFWSQAMDSFKESYSTKLDISIEQAYSPELIRKVKKGELDCAFASRAYDDDELQYVLVWSQPLVLAVNNKNPLAKRKAISLEKLVGQNVATYRPTSPASRCIDALEERYDLNLDRSYDDEITMSALVTSNAQVMALFCYSFLVNAFDDVTCLRLKDVPADAHKVYLVSRREMQTKTVQAFIDFMSRYRFPNILEIAELSKGA